MKTTDIKVSERTAKMVELLSKANELHREILQECDNDVEEGSVTESFMEVEAILYNLCANRMKDAIASSGYKAI